MHFLELQLKISDWFHYYGKKNSEDEPNGHL
jgi:hypothetical protein